MSNRFKLSILAGAMLVSGQAYAACSPDTFCNAKYSTNARGANCTVNVGQFSEQLLINFDPISCTSTTTLACRLDWRSVVSARVNNESDCRTIASRFTYSRGAQSFTCDFSVTTSSFLPPIDADRRRDPTPQFCFD